MHALDLRTVHANLPGYIPGGGGGTVRDSRGVVDDVLEPPRRVEQKSRKFVFRYLTGRCRRVRGVGVDSWACI